MRGSWSSGVAWAATVAVVFGAAEWLRGPGIPEVIWMVLATAVALVSLRSSGFRPHGLVFGGILGLLVVSAAYQFREIAATRREVDQGRSALRAAESHLSSLLAAQATRLSGLAREAAQVPLGRREQAFDRLERMLPWAAPEVTLVILDSLGSPIAWAGPVRLAPEAGDVPLGFRHTSYYATLEVRRHHAAGGVVVASVLLYADQVVPGGPGSLADVLRERQGVDVRFAAPDSQDGSFAWPSGTPVLTARFDPGPPGVRLARSWQAASGLGAVALVTLLVGLCLAGAPRVRAAGLLLALLVGLRAPLAEALGFDSLVSAAVYYSGVFGALTATAVALALTGLVGMVFSVGLWNRTVRRSRVLMALGLVLLLATPYAVRELARGITPPSQGVGLELWWTWQLGLLLPTAALLITVSALMRGRPEQPAMRWPGALAALSGLAAACLGVLAFTGRPGWPGWYTVLWIPALALAVWPARRAVTMVAIAVVAGSGAALLTWGSSLAGRIDVAVRDVEGLGLNPDPLVEPLLSEFARQISDAGTPLGATDLYRLWTRSALASQAYPTRLTLWHPDGTLLQDVRLDDLSIPDSLLRHAALAVEGVGVPTVQRAFAMPGIHHILSLHLDADYVVTVVTGPRTALIEPAPLGRIVTSGAARAPGYRLTVAAAPELRPQGPPDRWRRENWGLRMWRPVGFAGETREVTAVIPLGRPPWVFVRGALVVLLDVVLVAVVWLLADLVWSRPRHPIRWRTLARSYRARVAVALAAFCIVPAALLVGLSISQLANESRQTRDLLLQRVLADAAPRGGFPSGTAALAASLEEQAARVGAELAVYREGRLAGASGPVLRDLGVFPSLLDARVYHAIYLDLDATAAPRPQSGAGARTGYATVALGGMRLPAVLASAAPASDRALSDRRADLAMLLLLATIVGILAALAGARVAARSLARPVTDLRHAALAFGAGGDPAPLRSEPPPEFGPVFEAFGRMARDVRASQAALLEARRRTDAVLATVATGVVAVERGGDVILANRQAQEALGPDLITGRPLSDVLRGPWTDLHALVVRQLKTGGGEDGGIEVETGERRYKVQLASLGGELGGMVLAINDVTTTSRAARVLAWAEVANQVAHAIKNPLTPLRLGVQHLKRVQATRPGDLERTLDETGTRILAEIERLDAIARAFSRLAAPAEPNRPLEDVPVAEVAGEVAALYRLAPEVTVQVEVPVWVQWPARRDEFKEVLFNLFENARNAGASVITVRGSAAYIEVRDDGRGIPAELMPRVFEPRFSTTSSGSGLGLAIVRRLAESWGVTVGIESEPGRGTVVTIRRRVDGGD